ncbi:hypothetical protein KJ865_09615, partial [Myxococcota bacterium]|nr:hypothetical protein [Myxococcota bacterium]
MKTSLILLSFSLIALMAVPAGAQQIIIVPGGGQCPGASSYDAPPVSPYVAPMANPYAAPAPMVPQAPNFLPAKAIVPFRKWGLHAFGVTGSDDYGDLNGAGVAISYMFNHHFGVQAGVSALTAEDGYGYVNRIVTRSHVSALWFPGGVKTSGISLYFKAGLMKQSSETIMADYGAPLPYDSTYEDRYSESSPDGVGTTVVFGGGLQWRMLNGYVSLGLEATIVGPVEDEEYGETTSPSFNMA